MACHEIAALRLGMMEVLGIDDPAEKEHELQELGAAATEPGPLKSLTQGGNLEQLLRYFSISLSDLQDKVAKTPAGDPKLAYYKTLLVLTKKVEQDLQIQLDNLNRLYRDLDEIHHYVHEIYPA